MWGLIVSALALVVSMVSLLTTYCTKVYIALTDMVGSDGPVQITDVMNTIQAFYYTSINLLVAMGGVVITETIFDYAGLGQFAAKSAANLDFPAILGFSLYFAIVLVLMNLIVDLIYPLLDPRVKTR